MNDLLSDNGQYDILGKNLKHTIDDTDAIFKQLLLTIHGQWSIMLTFLL